MATEAARLKNQEPTGRKKKNRLDSNRPSHGRSYQQVCRSEMGVFSWIETKDSKARTLSTRMVIDKIFSIYPVARQFACE